MLSRQSDDPEKDDDDEDGETIDEEGMKDNWVIVYHIFCLCENSSGNVTQLFT